MTLRYFAGWDFESQWESARQHIRDGGEDPDAIIAQAAANLSAWENAPHARTFPDAPIDDASTTHLADLGDAIASGVAETLTPPPPLPVYRDHVVELGGRTVLYLYRWEADQSFAYGEDQRKAMHFTRAEADYYVAKLGDGWRSRRTEQ